MNTYQWVFFITFLLTGHNLDASSVAKAYNLPNALAGVYPQGYRLHKKLDKKIKKNIRSLIESYHTQQQFKALTYFINTAIKESIKKYEINPDQTKAFVKALIRNMHANATLQKNTSLSQKKADIITKTAQALNFKGKS